MLFLLFFFFFFFSDFLKFIIISELIISWFFYMFFFLNFNFMNFGILMIFMMIYESCLGIILIFEFMSFKKFFFQNNMFFF